MRLTFNSSHQSKPDILSSYAYLEAVENSGKQQFCYVARRLSDDSESSVGFGLAYPHFFAL
jgi:hypothetical protein